MRFVSAMVLTAVFFAHGRAYNILLHGLSLTSISTSSTFAFSACYCEPGEAASPQCCGIQNSQVDSTIYFSRLGYVCRFASDSMNMH